MKVAKYENKTKLKKMKLEKKIQLCNKKNKVLKI